MTRLLWYILILLFVNSSLIGESFKQNKIDQEPWIKYFTFMGPFKNENIADKAINEIFTNGIINSENI